MPGFRGWCSQPSFSAARRRSPRPMPGLIRPRLTGAKWRRSRWPWSWEPIWCSWMRWRGAPLQPPCISHPGATRHPGAGPQPVTDSRHHTFAGPPSARSPLLDLPLASQGRPARRRRGVLTFILRHSDFVISPSCSPLSSAAKSTKGLLRSSSFSFYHIVDDTALKLRATEVFFRDKAVSESLIRTHPSFLESAKQYSPTCSRLYNLLQSLSWKRLHEGQSSSGVMTVDPKAKMISSTKWRPQHALEPKAKPNTGQCCATEADGKGKVEPPC